VSADVSKQLFTPMKVGQMNLRHRIVFPAMSRLRAHWPTNVIERNSQFLAARIFSRCAERRCQLQQTMHPEYGLRTATVTAIRSAVWFKAQCI
jgi:hypothetical protein